MKRLRGTVVSVLLLVAWPCGAVAREYVVDGPNAAASDKNPGTAARPLKTIDRAAQLAEAGDRVLVRPGVYREAVRLRKSGLPGRPITFQAERPGKVVVTGADPVGDWQRVAGEVPVYRTAWPHVFPINHVNGVPVEHHPHDSPVFGRAEQVIADGRHLVATGTLDKLRAAWAEHAAAWSKRGRSTSLPVVPDVARPATWSGLFAVDTRKAKSLYVCLADGSDPRKGTVEASVRGLIFGVNPWQRRDGVSHVHVRGFVFRYGATFPQRAGVWLHGRDNVLEDCLVDGFAGSGVSVAGTMRRCTVRHCGQTGGGAQGRSFLNEDCLWQGNCWKPINRGWDAGGFKICRAYGGVFRRCAFVGNGGPGLWLDIDVCDVLITECAFVDNEHSGLFVEISRNITVTRNLALRNGLGPPSRKPSRLWSVGGIQIAESRDCTMTFNTCVGNKDGITFREQGPRPLDTPDGKIPFHNAGHVVAGNVCALNRGYQLGVWYDNGFFGWHPAEKRKFKTPEAYEAFLKTGERPVYDPTKQRMVIDRNLYFAGEGQKLILYGTPWRPKYRIFADVESFTQRCGFERAGRVADPGFVDAPAGNYRFKPGSAAAELKAGWSTAPPDVGAWLKRLGWRGG